MTEKIRGLIAARREQLAYLVVGVMTTVINYIIYVLLTEGISLHYAASNVIAWAAAVAFSASGSTAPPAAGAGGRPGSSSCPGCFPWGWRPYSSCCWWTCSTRTSSSPSCWWRWWWLL